MISGCKKKWKKMDPKSVCDKKKNSLKTKRIEFKKIDEFHFDVRSVSFLGSPCGNDYSNKERASWKEKREIYGGVKKKRGKE